MTVMGNEYTESRVQDLRNTLSNIDSHLFSASNMLCALRDEYTTHMDSVPSSIYKMVQAKCYEIDASLSKTALTLDTLVKGIDTLSCTEENPGTESDSIIGDVRRAVGLILTLIDEYSTKVEQDRRDNFSDYNEGVLFGLNVALSHVIDIIEEN